MQKPIRLLVVPAIGVLIYLVVKHDSDSALTLAEGDSKTSAPADLSEGSPLGKPLLGESPDLGRQAPRSDHKRSSMPFLRYPGSEPEKQDLPAPPPLTGQQLAENYPVAMSRIQEGLTSENGAAIRECLAGIDVLGSAPLRFDVTVNVAIDGEVGIVDSIDFPEPPDELSDVNKTCLTDTMAALSFDGMDIAFEGAVTYPFVVQRLPSTADEGDTKD